MSVPSIKGVALEAIVRLAHELLELGWLSRDQLEARLEQPDLDLLEEKPEPSLWYPIASVERIDRLVAEVLGRDLREMMREIGVTSAKSILSEGGAIHAFIDGARKHRERMGHVLTGVGRLMVNFGEWSFEGDISGEFRVEATNMEHLPDTARYAAEGFIEMLVRELTDRPTVVSTRKPSPSHVIFEGRVGA